MVLTQPVSSERVHFELGTTNLFRWLLAALTQPLVCTENLIRVDAVMESRKLTE